MRSKAQRNGTSTERRSRLGQLTATGIRDESTVLDALVDALLAHTLTTRLDDHEAAATIRS